MKKVDPERRVFRSYRDYEHTYFSKKETERVDVDGSPRATGIRIARESFLKVRGASRTNGE